MCSKNYHIRSHCLGIDKNNLKNYKAGKNSTCATFNNLATNLTEKHRDRAATKKRYNDTAIQEPEPEEPGTVHNLCKLALCTTGDIHDNNLQGGGGRNSKIV
jgi:hypothetical protein